MKPSDVGAGVPALQGEAALVCFERRGVKMPELQAREAIHCGACMENFDTMTRLANHLDSCKAAKVILPLVQLVYFAQQDVVGHRIAYIIHQLPKNTHLVNQYAYAIAYEFDNMSRVRIHKQLCEALEIPHADFKPFESSAIKELPTVEEATNIIYDAVFAYAIKKIGER